MKINREEYTCFYLSFVYVSILGSDAIKEYIWILKKGLKVVRTFVASTVGIEPNKALEIFKFKRFPQPRQ